MLAVSQPVGFTCRVAPDGNRRALVVGGEIDLHTAAALRRAVDSSVASGAASLVLDLRDVTFVDVAGLTFLLDLRRRGRRGGFALELIPPRAEVMRLFDLTQTREALQFSEAV